MKTLITNLFKAIGKVIGKTWALLITVGLWLCCGWSAALLFLGIYCWSVGVLCLGLILGYSARAASV